jgi:hypothetical protein
MGVQLMDIGLAQEAILGLSGIGGTAGVVSTLKMIYNDHCYRQDKTALEQDYKALDARVDRLAEEITDNAILVAREYVLKTDIEKLKEHIDGQFTETRNLIFTALAGQKSQ